MNFKIASWNINSVKIRLQHLIEFIETHNPDIICIQELKCQNDKFPYNELEDFPYNLYIHGQKAYNGVAILSKIPADIITTEFPNNPISDQARFIEIALNTPIGFSRIISLYAPNGGEVNSDKFIQKLEFYDWFFKYIYFIKSFAEHIFICADFNIAPFDIDVYDPKSLQESTGFTLKERKKLRTIFNLGFIDNFRIKNLNKQEFSWWDYRAGAFEQNRGMRIDSIISTSNVIKYLDEFYIDYKTREKLQPSDHAPVIAKYSICC